MADRRQRASYDEWARVARRVGVSEQQIEDFITEGIREAEEVAAGRCPKCGHPVCRKADPRQHGPGHLEGTWIMLWCSQDAPPGTKRESDICGFRSDWNEGN